MIRRLLRRLAGPPTPPDAGRALAARAIAIRTAARRAWLQQHLAQFGAAGERGLKILNGETENV
jgi:hypothetical protein